ncbi:MAG: VOC family protein [Acidobacteria bacterium]|nr:VOC family protein [Acidobacteriota bacterium]
MGNPIVYFEVAGPDAAQLRSFYANVFGWQIDGSATIASASTGGLRGGIRQDPPDKVFYMGVDDIEAVLGQIEAQGGAVVLSRTVVPGVVTFALFRDPAGNLLGIAENGTYAS